MRLYNKYLYRIVLYISILYNIDITYIYLILLYYMTILPQWRREWYIFKSRNKKKIDECV